MRSPQAESHPLNAPSPLADLHPPQQPSQADPQPRPISLPGTIPSDAPTTHMATTLSSSPTVSNQTSLRHSIAPAQRPNTPNGVQDEPPSKRRRTNADPPLAAPLMLPPSVQISVPAPILRSSQVAPLPDSQPSAALPIAPETRPSRLEEGWSDAQTPAQAGHESPTHTANDSTADKPSPNNASASTYRATSDMVISEESRPPVPVQIITSTATVSAHPKDTRRIWNRRSLERSGISSNALRALELFMRDVPPIPIQPDHNRKQTRNMRGWIQQLERPACDTVWDKLMDVLRTDFSPQRAFGDHWDHDVCRFVLGHVVSENRSSQTRQAMNNAIKRELICPTESGNSTRGKTFRDLFREKCQKAGVKLNALEDGAYPKRSSHATTFSGRNASVGPTDVPTRFVSEYEDSSGARLFSHLSLRRSNEARASESELKKLREGCPHRDEWGQTAWWELESNEAVRLLPELLVDHSLFELRNLLTDFRWMMRMFRCVDFSHGMYQPPAHAYDVILNYARSKRSRLPSADVESFRLVRNAIMVILPVLFKHKARPSDPGFHAHLATQLTGRLLSLKRKFPTIACLIQSIELHAPKPWLKPLTRCFRQPRTDIALAVPSEGIFVPHQLVLSDDGQFLVTTNASMREPRNKMKLEPTAGPTGMHGNGKKSSASQPQSRPRKTISITVWDVNSGKRVGEVTNISSHVSHVAITKDNNCIIGETYDGLFFWHFDKRETWEPRAPLRGLPREKGLSSIKPTATPDLVLTTHKTRRRSVIVLWNTQTGKKEKEYDAVESKPNCVDTYSKRQYFASGHDNGFIHLWNWKDARPILTFKNEGSERGAQNGVSLSDANNQKDSSQSGQASARTISISFFERESDLSLASVSSEGAGGGQEYIRIWVLPPKKFLDGSSQAFVSCKRAAVWKCRLVRQVFCSADGSLFTGGDDGVARMWEREEDDTWKEYTIEKDSNEDSKMSSTFICCGKKTKLMATYVTKSPYVVVWNTKNKELRRTIMTSTGVYKPYIPIDPHSVDVADMNQYQVLKRDKGTGEFGDGGRSGQGGSKHQQGSKKLWDNPEFFFRQHTQDSNSVIRPGELQPWLQLKLERGNDMPGLDVCFDQPVTSGVTGLFVNAPNSVGDIAGAGSEDGKRDGRDVLRRRGMAIKLEDKRTELFEVEGGVQFGRVSGVEPSEGKSGGEKGASKAVANSTKASANEKEGTGNAKEVANAAAPAGDVSSVT
ncbi:WD40-repeat containing protein [Gracilaria domingensis]|nr:WD40-repeat containing protein [Gracilaria domingensis]